MASDTRNNYLAVKDRGHRMRTTLNIDDALLAEARHVTGLTEETALVKAALIALIEKKSAKRLASLGGTEKELRAIPRR